MYQKGIKILTNVAWGLVIVFFAWIIIDTIIKVVAGQSLTSGAPAVLPKEPTSPFQEGPLVGINPVVFGPWNKIQCTRAPKRTPLALLEIPPEFQCVNGQPVKPIPGFNSCDRLVAQNIADWNDGHASSFNGTPANGVCKSGVLGGGLQAKVIQAAQSNSIDPQYFQALVIHESGGKPWRVSGKGAIGLGQLMPDTARDLHTPFRSMTDAEVTRELINNPDLNLNLSAKYVRGRLNLREVNGNYSLATAAYNAGDTGVRPPKKNNCQAQYAYQCIAETTAMIPAVDAKWEQIKTGACNPGGT